jgi:hypothetical protein
MKELCSHAHDHWTILWINSWVLCPPNKTLQFYGPLTSQIKSIIDTMLYNQSLKPLPHVRPIGWTYFNST